jgi:N-acetylmuramoyl-L-alanine amidase
MNMNSNVLKDRLERIERALDVMRDPDAPATLIETAYTTGVRDALQGVLDDSPEEDR